MKTHQGIFGLNGMTALLAVVAGMSWSGTTRAEEACGVPVCDIPAKIAQLRASDESFRYKALHQIYSEYRKTESLAVMRNMKEFGIAARTLTTELKDDDYVIREASYIIDVAAIGLARYAPIDLDSMLENYAMISGQNGRWQVLSYWSGRITDIERNADLEAMVLFGEASARYGIDHQEDDYMIRESRHIISGASSRLVELNPFHEGAYELTLQCTDESNQTVDSPFCHTRYPINRMVVLNVEKNHQVVVALLNRELGQPLLVLPNVTVVNRGRTMKGTAPDTATATEFAVEVDPRSGKAVGWLKNTQSNERVSFSGRRVVTPVAYYQHENEGPGLDPQQIEGVYQGTFAGMKGKLIIRQIHPDNAAAFFAATFIDGKTGTRIDFQNGDFLASRSILRMIYSPNSTGMYQKWILSLQQSGNGQMVFTGMSFSTITGAYSDLQFTRMN